MIKWKPLLISIALSLGVGGLAAFLTKNSILIYETLRTPPLSPPPAVFPVVWTLLYILMGISAYLVYTAWARDSNSALKVYALQLVVNFFWPIIFFNLEMFFVAFIWILILLVLVVLMIRKFNRVDKRAAVLQIPYLLWILFASYLNLGIALLN